MEAQTEKKKTHSDLLGSACGAWQSAAPGGNQRVPVHGPALEGTCLLSPRFAERSLGKEGGLLSGEGRRESGSLQRETAGV